MSSVPQTQHSIELGLLQTAPLKNEEIIELLAFICSAEAIAPFAEHVNILRDRYDMTLEVRSIDIEVLSLREKFPMRSLRNYFEAASDQGFYSLIIDAITGYQTDIAGAVYIERLEQVFNVSPDEKFIRDTLRIIDDRNMEGPGINAIRKHYQDLLDKVAEYAPIPKYIHDYDIRINELPRLEEKQISEDLPDDYIAEYLLTQLGNLDLGGLSLYIAQDDETTAKEKLTDVIGRMNPNQRTDFINLFKVDPEEIESVRNNRDVFRVYGPVNPFQDTDFSNLFNENGEPDVNIIFGGERLFTSMALEYDYDSDLPAEDWFRNYCLQCSKRIRAYHHAVREPNMTGGWRGCYCSWDCVIKFVELDYEQDPDHLNLYAAKVALIREFERQMNEYGIADRDYEIPDETENDGIEGQDYDEDRVEELKAKLPNIQLLETPIISLPEDYGQYGTYE